MGYTGEGKDRNIWKGRLAVTELDPKESNDLTTKKYVDDTHVPAGSEGEVQFNESSKFQADSDFFWDNVNKRLGIGTSSPAFKLSVDEIGAGTLAVPTDVYLWKNITAGNPSLRLYGYGGVGGTTLKMGKFQVVDSFQMYASTDATNIRLTVADPDNAHIGFNVGGTYTSTVIVNRDANKDGLLEVRGNEAQTGTDATEKGSLKMTSDGFVVSSLKGDINLISDDNVGIGDINPTYSFSIGSTDNTDQIGIHHDNFNAFFNWTDGTLLFHSDEADAATAVTVRGSPTDNAGIALQGRYAEIAVDTTATTNDKQAYYMFRDEGTNKYAFTYSQGNGDFYIYDYANSKLFFNYDQSKDNLLLQQSGGNVGIGVTDPDKKFQVRGNQLDRDIVISPNDAVKDETHGLSLRTDVNGGLIDFRKSGFINYNTDDLSGSRSLHFIEGVDAPVEVMTITGGTTIGNVGIGVTDPHSTLEVNGAISSATTTFSTEGPTDNVDVSGVNTLFVDTSSNNVTIGGFAGGVAGQYLHIIKTSGAAVNDLILEHNEGGGSQDLQMHQEVDETVDAGGVLMVCDGTDWWDCSHARHV